MQEMGDDAPDVTLEMVVELVMARYGVGGTRQKGNILQAVSFILRHRTQQWSSATVDCMREKVLPDPPPPGLHGALWPAVHAKGKCEKVGTEVLRILFEACSDEAKGAEIATLLKKGFLATFIPLLKVSSEAGGLFRGGAIAARKRLALAILMLGFSAAGINFCGRLHITAPGFIPAIGDARKDEEAVSLFLAHISSTAGWATPRFSHSPLHPHPFFAAF